MAATVKIYRLTGSGPTATDITSINTRADLSDAHSTASTSNPVQIPSAGTNYSYWVSTRLTASGVFTSVDNIKWYSDGTSLGTGVDLKVATVPSAGYTQATDASQLTDGNYSGGSLTPTTPVSHSTYDSGSPLTVSGTLTSSGDVSSIVVFQVEVGTSASPGATGSPTFSWQYDEI